MGRIGAATAPLIIASLLLGLLGLTLLLVASVTQAQRWHTAHWKHPRGKGPTYQEHLDNLERTGNLPWHSSASAVNQMAHAAYAEAIQKDVRPQQQSGAATEKQFVDLVLGQPVALNQGSRYRPGIRRHGLLRKGVGLLR